MKKDPCQRRACDIQYCLQRNNYKETSCQAEIAALQECCKKWSKESGCCAGVKVDSTSTNSTSPSQKENPTSATKKE